MVMSWFMVVALVVTAIEASITPEKQILEKSVCGRVWLTVHSPEIRKGADILHDALELNWDFNGCPVVPRQIALFKDKPVSFNDALVVYLITVRQGFVITNISLGSSTLPSQWENGPGAKGPHCLWPWVGAGDRLAVQSYNCLKIQPTWMEDNIEKIKDLRIGDLAIAGTHNAGAWQFDTEIVTATTADIFVQMQKLLLCQDRSVWSQLVHGIRYLDLRVGYYNVYEKEEDRYWLNHDVFQIRPLVPILREIRHFLDATKEIVFLDAHRLPVGFDEDDGSPSRHVHAGLLELIQRELGPHLAMATEFHTGEGTRGPTVKSLISANKRLVFSYIDNAIVNDNRWLWPKLPHLWANTNSVPQLFSYLDNAIESHAQSVDRPPMHSAMAQTTPTLFDVLFLGRSIRINADAVNRDVTTRVKSTWRQIVNIVSTDFFLGNDVVDTCIALNVERGARL